MLITVLEHAKRSLGAPDLFEIAFENASIPMALVCPYTGKWVAINRATEVFLERPKDEILQHTFQDYTAAEDEDGNLSVDLQLVKECIDGKRDSFQLDKAYRMPDLRVKHGHLAASLVRFGGAPLIFISQITDTEAQFQLERDLRKALDRERKSREFLERELEILRGTGKSDLVRDFEKLLHELGDNID